MSNFTHPNIINSLKNIYLADKRPWVIGYSGGKDSTMLVSLVFEMLVSIAKEDIDKDIAIICTDTRVEIPAIAERIEDELKNMQTFSDENSLNIHTYLLKSSVEQSFWVNVIGRGYPPPNRMFRWCTQRLKIDPVNKFIRNKLGQWGEAIILLGARRSESSTRSQTMAARPANNNGLRRHNDLPRCWVATPIEYLNTYEVWDYLLEKPNIWGGDNQTLYKLYKDASSGECPLIVDKETPSCGNSRFGCWTCTVVVRDKASEGLLASGDQRMEKLLQYRERLLEIQKPENGYRDLVRKNGQDGPGPITIEARKILLTELLDLQKTTNLPVITEEELHWIQSFWKTARNPDDGLGVSKIMSQYSGIEIPNKHSNMLKEVEIQIADKHDISLDILDRLIGKIKEYEDTSRATGLLNELEQILKDSLNEQLGIKNV